MNKNITNKYYGDKFGIKNFLEMQDNPLEFLCNAHRHCGATATMRCGPYRLISVTEDRHIEHVLKSNPDNYLKRTPGYAGMREYLGNGLLTHEGGRSWRVQSRQIRPLFHLKHINALAPMIIKWVDVFCDEIESNKNGINLSSLLRRLTLTILCDAMFKYDQQDEIAKVSEDIGIGISYSYAKLYDPFFWLSIKNRAIAREFQKAKKRLLTFAKKIIDRSADIPGTLPNLLISKHTDDEQIIDEIITMLQAGHETSATALNAMFYRALQSPIIQRKIYNNSIALNDEKLIIDIHRFDYTNQFIWESLRFDPSTWAFDRYTLSKDNLGGLAVNKGDLIVISPYIKHRLFGNWQESSEFNPEKNFPDMMQTNSKDFIPFSIGPRLCPGSALAYMEIRTIVTRFFQRFSFSCHELNDIYFSPSITLKLSSDIICHASKNQDPLNENGNTPVSSVQL